MNSEKFRLIIPQPTGGCSGVKNTLDFLDHVRARYPLRRIFVNHEPIHHKEGTRRLEKNGMKLLRESDIAGLGPGDIVIGSAHGTPLDEISAVKARGATFMDATCPLVEANFSWIENPGKYIVIHIGKGSHREDAASVSRIKSENVFSIDTENNTIADVVSHIKNKALAHPIVLVRQTTIPADNPTFSEIKQKLESELSEFQFVKNRGECYATENRQLSLRRSIELYAPACVLVLTSQSSSNGKELVDAAGRLSSNVFWGEDAQELSAHAEVFLKEASSAVLVAAASVTDEIVSETEEHILQMLRASGRESCSEKPWLVDKEREPILKFPAIL